jgi:hypothetical protein
MRGMYTHTHRITAQVRVDWRGCAVCAIPSSSASLNRLNHEWVAMFFLYMSSSSQLVTFLDRSSSSASVNGASSFARISAVGVDSSARPSPAVCAPPSSMFLLFRFLGALEVTSSAPCLSHLPISCGMIWFESSVSSAHQMARTVSSGTFLTLWPRRWRTTSSNSSNVTNPEPSSSISEKRLNQVCTERFFL